MALAWILGWTALGLAAAPLGAVVGGVVGAIKARPPDHVERDKATLITAMSQAQVPDSIRDEVVRLGLERTGLALVPLARQEPETGDRDVDTVMDIIVRRMGLERRSISDKWASGWSDLDPDFDLRVAVDVELLRAKGGEVLSSKSFEELGAARKFSDWAAGDGRAFREGLEEASSHLAIQIADHFFRATPPATEVKEEESKPEPPPEPKGDDNRTNWD
jgi:hypothetical protein